LKYFFILCLFFLDLFKISSHIIDMFLKITKQKNKDGTYRKYAHVVESDVNPI